MRALTVSAYKRIDLGAPSFPRFLRKGWDAISLFSCPIDMVDGSGGSLTGRMGSFSAAEA
jgi:hypothetical protein